MCSKLIPAWRNTKLADQPQGSPPLDWDGGDWHEGTENALQFWIGLVGHNKYHYHLPPALSSTYNRSKEDNTGEMMPNMIAAWTNTQGHWGAQLCPVRLQMKPVQ